MANTINDLYTKYTNKVERTLENDRYFQYLFEMVQAGDNTLQQKNQQHTGHENSMILQIFMQLHI